MISSRKGIVLSVRTGFILALVLAVSCQNDGDRSPVHMGEAQRKNDQDGPYEEMAAKAGLDFVHFNGMTGDYFFCEIMGSGGALLDFDGDGDQDIFLVQGRLLGKDKQNEDATFPFIGKGPPRDRLFRNDTTIAADGAPQMKFTDVTDQSGLSGLDYGMGAAIGDFDNDGRPDLYVANFGPNRLYRNKGGGVFEEVTRQAGAEEPSLSVSAAFVDIDRDGWLDLFIGNYTDYSLENNERCFSGGVLDYCHPSTYDALPDRLLRNNGDGTFRDITASSGLASAYGRALGVSTADFNNDGWIDIYVANDTTANQLWINQKDGTFSDEAMIAGCALNEMGVAEASMGVDAGDFDRDGDDDLFMTHYRNETNTIYVNNGHGTFVDRTIATGLGAPSIPFTGFGVAWLDYDNDAFLDLFIANGAVISHADVLPPGDPFPYHQPNQLFRNMGNGAFEEVGTRSGPAFALSEVSRGALFGDLDNDGDTDLVVANNSGPVRLLVNKVGSQNAWIGFRALARPDGWDALGTRIGVFLEDGEVLWRRVRNDASYASANDPRVLIGLGDATEIIKVELIWPDGKKEAWPGLKTGRYHTLIKGSSIQTGEAGPQQ